MSSAIDFAVRTAAGGTTYGHVAGPGESTFIQAGLGDRLSLNLTPQSVIGYTRNGNDLVIELSDGRKITVADWFDAPVDNPNTLYLSSNGMVTEVQLTDPGDGILVAGFALAAGHEKWSPLDDLRFDNSDPVVTLAGTGEDDPAGMGIFAPALLGWGGAGLGAAAIIGGGALIGGGGDGGGGGPTYTRSIAGEGTTATITTNTTNPAITVTGTGIPGDSVLVTIGTRTQTVTVTPEGTWTAGFSGPNLPLDGTHTATAVFTGGGTTDTLTGGGFVIDMTPPPLAATEGVGSTGANAMQRARFGVIPQITPVLLSQVLYYLESNTRSATVIGAIVGGGVGLLLTQAIQTQKDWEEVAYYMVLIVLMVMLMDSLSGWLRRKLIRGE